MQTLSMLCASSKTTTHSFSSSRDTMLDTCRIDGHLLIHHGKQGKA